MRGSFNCFASWEFAVVPWIFKPEEPEVLALVVVLLSLLLAAITERMFKRIIIDVNV